MQDNYSRFTEKNPLSYNTDLLYPTQQNQNPNQYIFSSFGQNPNPTSEKMNYQDTLSKQYTSNNTLPISDLDYNSNKFHQKIDTDIMSLMLKDTTIKSNSLTPNNGNNQNEQLIQKIGMLEIQNKEQEERILNLQKLNDQLMSAITDLNGNDQNKQKYQKDKDLLQKQHEKEISDYVSQIKDLKNKLELQKAQMNEKVIELEKDKLLLEKQLDDEEKNYQKKLQSFKEEKDQMNQILKDYESMRQKNQEAIQITLENKIRILEEVIEKQKLEAEERTGQLTNDTEKNIQNMKQIHENEKNILLNKISGLQGEKKMIEQQSEYNFKMFTELRNKSENQQDGLYNELDKTRKFINGLEQQIMEKESIIIIQQQKIDGNDTVLRLKEKNYEESLKTLKLQNEQLQEQMKKQQHELKHLQFLNQEKQFELTDKSKQLKKQIWNEKKKAEQLQEAANRIKDDYTKKNSFVIQELLMKEEKIKKLNTQIHKHTSLQNQIAQLNYNSNNNNNNTSYSFINNTNLSNLMQNPNHSMLQQNQNGSQNRPSYRQLERNQQLTTSNNTNMIINQENFNSSDNLNIINNHSVSKSPKLQMNHPININGSVMSQFQESCSVPLSSRSRNNNTTNQIQKSCCATPSSCEHLAYSNPNFNQSRIQHPRSASNYQSEMHKNNSQNQITIEKSTLENFNSCQVINNLLSINSPTNTTTLPQLTNEFMSPQSQKLDLSRSELNTMRGLTPTLPSQNCIQDQQQKETVQKSKRSLSQAVSSLGNGVNQKSTNKIQSQQPQKISNQAKQASNKSISHSPLTVQQKEITGNNLTLVTYDASQKNFRQIYQTTNNCDDSQNTSICTPNTNKKTAINGHNINNSNANRSTSPIHHQSVNSCNSHRDIEKTKKSSSSRNVSVDQNKKSNKVVGVTLNTCRGDNIQQQSSHTKTLSVSATPLSSVSLNLLMNPKDEGQNNYNNQLAFTPDTKNQSLYTTPNTQRNSNNQNASNSQQGNQPIYKNASSHEINSFQNNNSTLRSNQNSIMNMQNQRRDITFGTPNMTDNIYSEMSQKVSKTLDDHNFSSQATSNNVVINNTQIPLQSKIRKILNQFNFVQMNSQSKLNTTQNNKQNTVESYQYNTQYQQQQQYPNYTITNLQQCNQTNQREIEAIFFEQMREAIQTYPEMNDYNNLALRKSMENKDMNLALNGLREIIQKININEQEKRELQIEINTIQSKCSLEKASLQNNPTLAHNNVDTQNNLHTTSMADSKINQIILDNLQTKTFETQTGITFTQEKENVKALPLSLEINNKFKPITQTTQNGYPVSVNNLSLNLNGLKSPQFTTINDDKNFNNCALQQNNDYLNEYNSNVENMPHENNQQQQKNVYNQNNYEVNIKSSKLNEKNHSQTQFNTARVNNQKNIYDQNQPPQNNGKVQNKHASSISISISNCNADQSPTMYRVNGGLNHQKNSSSINPLSVTNFNNSNSAKKINGYQSNDKDKNIINFSLSNNGNSVISNKSITQQNLNYDQLKNSSRNTPKVNTTATTTTTNGHKKSNPLKDIIQY